MNNIKFTSLTSWVIFWNAICLKRTTLDSICDSKANIMVKLKSHIIKQ